MISTPCSSPGIRGISFQLINQLLLTTAKLKSLAMASWMATWQLWNRIQDHCISLTQPCSHHMVLSGCQPSGISILGRHLTAFSSAGEYRARKCAKKEYSTLQMHSQYAEGCATTISVHCTTDCRCPLILVVYSNNARAIPFSATK